MIGYVDMLHNGGIGVIPTDTVYGVVASAMRPDAVDRLYKVRGRAPEKPCIILISNIEDLTQFDIHPDKMIAEKLNEFWPGPVSIILPCPYAKFAYLHRGTGTLAFRLPDKFDLVSLIQQTGPLLAPSANPEGSSPAESVAQARTYFGQGVDFYIDGGTLISKPSTLISLEGGNVHVLRQGIVKIQGGS